MSLKLSLKPGETFIVNGAVVRNGERRGVLLLENQARILREKDIMQPEDAVTPAAQAYFAVMQMYLTGCLDGAYYDEFCRTLSALMAIQVSEAKRADVLSVSEDVTSGKLYKALGRCRKLMAAEHTAAGKAA
ncbi:MAG: flagellar biosynthesis repressor FlbT [Hyphomonadaceae bacterium]